MLARFVTVMPNVEVSGLRGFLRRSARLPGRALAARLSAGFAEAWDAHPALLPKLFQ